MAEIADNYKNLSHSTYLDNSPGVFVLREDLSHYQPYNANFKKFCVILLATTFKDWLSLYFGTKQCKPHRKCSMKYCTVSQIGWFHGVHIIKLKCQKCSGISQRHSFLNFVSDTEKLKMVSHREFNVKFQYPFGFFLDHIVFVIHSFDRELC